MNMEMTKMMRSEAKTKINYYMMVLAAALLLLLVAANGASAQPDDIQKSPGQQPGANQPTKNIPTTELFRDTAHPMGESATTSRDAATCGEDFIRNSPGTPRASPGHLSP
jgi:hypothetical protein